jgi:hypothetical protein
VNTGVPNANQLYKERGDQNVPPHPFVLQEFRDKPAEPERPLRFSRAVRIAQWVRKWSKLKHRARKLGLEFLQGQGQRLIRAGTKQHDMAVVDLNDERGPDLVGLRTQAGWFGRGAY